MAQKIENAILQEMLKKNADGFHKEILRLFEHKGFHYPVSGIELDFKILLPTDDAFFQSAARKKMIGIAIREKLVNPTLKELFQAQWDIDVSVDNSSAPYLVFPDNDFLEKSHPFEFIVPTNKGNIGYRYTPVPGGNDKKIRQWFKQYNLSYIYTIDWDRDGDDFIGFKYSEDFPYANKMGCISLRDFFTTYFTAEEYEVCLKAFREAVRQVWNYIDISTVPELSPRYLFEFKQKTCLSLLDNKIDELKYYFIERQTWQNITDLLPDQIIQSIQSKCFTDGLYKCLYGKSDFAKCFLTAEYLYSIFQHGNNQMEYTSVICGYLKCVEQFLYLIVKSMLSSGQFSNSYILLKGGSSQEERRNQIVIPNPRFANTNSSRNAPLLIKFLPVYESRFNTSIASLVNFLDDNEDAWLIPQGRTAICRLLRNFTKNCRNDYFHKDNIKQFSKITPIRSNTICILLLLLGNIKFQESQHVVEDLLEIYDDSFDRLVRKMKEIFPHDFYFILQYGERSIKAYRLYNQPLIKYNDEFGTLEDNSIHFVCVDSFENIPFPDDMHFDEWLANKPKHIITKNDRLPDRIILVRHGKEYEITW